MKSFVIGIACALLLVSFVPLVTAQEEQPIEQPIEQPPIIPPELAEGISEMSQGPLMSVIMAGLAFVVALVVDFIDTGVALGVDALDTIVAWLFSQYSILGVLFALISIIPVIGWSATLMKGVGHVLLFVIRYTPLVRYIVVLWDLLKFTAGVI